MKEKLAYTVGILAVLAMWGVIAMQAVECSKVGGTLVRGVITFECIQQPQTP